MKVTETEYVRRTQKDYTMAFKLSVIREYEENDVSLESLQRKYGIQGSHTLKRWLDKFGTFDQLNKCSRAVKKTKDQKLLALEQKVKLLERKNARLEKELENKDMKSEFFDLMIDIAEKEFKIDIRKKSYPEQSSNTKK